MDFAKRYLVDPENLKIADMPTSDKKAIGKKKAAKQRATDVEALDELQERLYAEGKHSLLIVLQALDAAGKDSTIEHVMTGVNPQGVRVTSFKEPSENDLKHHFLWRCKQAVPKPGEIGIFNRSQYEDVLVVRVHPEYLSARDIDPAEGAKDEFWQGRFDQINTWEEKLVDGGTEVIKFFLHISRDEQRARFLARGERPEKNWKFSASDVKEREHYDEYQRAYEQVLRHTSKPHAPWYIIPADQKWLMRTAVASIIRGKLEEMDPQWPVLSVADRKVMDEAMEKLRAEG